MAFPGKKPMSPRAAQPSAAKPAQRASRSRKHRVWSRTLQVLEDEAAARSWLTRRNRALGGEVPLALLDTDFGYGLVLDTLARIEYGIVS